MRRYGLIIICIIVTTVFAVDNNTPLKPGNDKRMLKWGLWNRRRAPKISSPPAIPTIPDRSPDRSCSDICEKRIESKRLELINARKYSNKCDLKHRECKKQLGKASNCDEVRKSMAILKKRKEVLTK